MPTNLALYDQLIQEAQLIGNHKAKKAAVTEALKEYIERRKQHLYAAFRFSPLTH